MNHIHFHTLTKPYLIGEIGINHNGNMQIAKKLIDAVSACESDCAKFQKRNPDKAVPEAEKNKPRETPWGTMTYLEYKYRVEFGAKDYDYIKQYCADSHALALPYQLAFIKIPSAMLTNKELLTATTKSGVPVILSTGMSTREEIDVAVGLLEQHASPFALMHTRTHRGQGRSRHPLADACARYPVPRGVPYARGPIGAADKRPLRGLITLPMRKRSG